MTSQLDQWRGPFGDAYTDRNIVNPRTRKNWFRDHIPNDAKSVLEVGSNVGHNLIAIDMARPDIWSNGIEPNEHARSIALTAGIQVYPDDIYNLPHPYETFDLVFTSGVLIHIPPHRLDEALTNLYNTSDRYLLAIEYRRDTDTTLEYRGHRDMLWAADYGAHYQQLFPDLELISEGALTEADGFNNSYYWLLRKGENHA